MRKAMICASFMLALVQLWPMIFGHRVAPSARHATIVAVAPHLVPAVANADTTPQWTLVQASPPLPQSCHRQYEARLQRCGARDQTCRVMVADQWDLCEATGLWPQ